MPLSPNVRFLRASLVLTFQFFLLSEAVSSGVVIPPVSSSLAFGATNPLPSFACQPLSYHRFPTAAEAIRLAVEGFSRYLHTRCMDAGWRWPLRRGGYLPLREQCIRVAVARGNPVEICTDIGLSLTYVAMSATLSARRLSFWPPQRFRLCDFVQDWWGYLVVRKHSLGSRWMLANLFQLDQLEAESPDIQ
jgi:hypothetical protein